MFLCSKRIDCHPTYLQGAKIESLFSYQNLGLCNSVLNSEEFDGWCFGSIGTIACFVVGDNVHFIHASRAYVVLFSVLSPMPCGNIGFLAAARDYSGYCSRSVQIKMALGTIDLNSEEAAVESMGGHVIDVMA